MNKGIIQESPTYSSREITADYHIKINNNRIPCNRKILETSPYLEKLLNTSIRSPGIENELTLIEERQDIFEIILAYLYDCNIEFAYLNNEQQILLLERAHLYCLNDLFDEVKKHIEFGLNYDNILKLTQSSELFQLDRFREICLSFIETNITQLSTHESFVRNLTREQLVYICTNLELYITEQDVLHFVENWIRFRTDISEDDKRNIRLSCIRLNRFDELQFNSILDLFTREDYQNSLQIRYESERKDGVMEVDFFHHNVVNIKQGHNTDKLLENNTEQLEKLSDYPYCGNGEPMIIDLGEIRLINLIELCLVEEMSKCNYSFAYYVETSLNYEDGYYRVIDHSDYSCRSKQRIYFYPREVRYIKICVVSSYSNLDIDSNYLYLRSFSCKLTNDNFDISRGFWSPNMRITDSNMGCFLKVGQNDPDDNSDWMLTPGTHNKNYSYHKMGKRYKKQFLMVHLSQPVYINSTYTYLIENCVYRIKGGTNPDILALIRSNINENMLTFDNLLVLFLKIQGYSEDLERFKCIDFSNVN